MSAWIETTGRSTPRAAKSSRTLRECVDWNPASAFWLIYVVVALFVSAWIETNRVAKRSEHRRGRTLRECVDWNCNINEQVKDKKASHSSWVRGLKPLYICINKPDGASHSSWVRGLKPARMDQRKRRRGRTLRECVDWNCKTPLVVNSEKSHSSWVRGLKLVDTRHFCIHTNVALFVSAWIETIYGSKISVGSNGRTLRECVDWNYLWQ